MGPHVEVRPVDAVAALDVVAGTVVRLDEVRAATGMDAVVADLGIMWSLSRQP